MRLNQSINCIFQQIIVILQVSYLVSSSVLPLPFEASTETKPPAQPQLRPPENRENPVIFSHDTNPFDALSYSFQSGSNVNISKPDFSTAVGSPVTKFAKVLPLSGNARQQRVNVFRPLFVYRQEQAMKRRKDQARPPFDPDRFYHYPHYSYHSQHHQHAHRYPDYYEPYPYKNYDYISNEVANGAPDYWYPYH